MVAQECTDHGSTFDSRLFLSLSPRGLLQTGGQKEQSSCSRAQTRETHLEHFVHAERASNNVAIAEAQSLQLPICHPSLHSWLNSTVVGKWLPVDAALPSRRVFMHCASPQHATLLKGPMQLTA